MHWGNCYMDVQRVYRDHGYLIEFASFRVLDDDSPYLGYYGRDGLPEYIRGAGFDAHGNVSESVYEGRDFWVDNVEDIIYCHNSMVLNMIKKEDIEGWLEKYLAQRPNNGFMRPMIHEQYYYPDYVCGVWTETGDMSELVVAVTKDEAGEAGKEEILSLIENDNTVKFVYQTYSYTELRDIQEELSPLMADNGVYGLGVDEMNNRVNVDVDMNHPNINAFMEECNAKYGDRVYFEAGSEIILEAGEVFTPTVGAVTSEETFTPVEIGGVFTVEETYKAPDENGADGAAVITIGASENKADNPWIFVLCAAVVVFLAGMVFVLNKNKAKQTTAGTIVGGTSLNLRETEKLVFESAETPSGKVFEEVMKEIGE